jgi:Uma2 family endonuclease
MMSIAIQPAPPTPTEHPTPAILQPPSMSTPVSTAPASVRVVDRLYRLTVEQYHAMGEAGILGSEDRVELLEGLIVTKMGKGQPHIIVTEILARLLYRIVPDGWFPSIQNPVTIAERKSEPEPDVKIVRGEILDYMNRRITPGDLVLVVEVSDSSVHDDQTTKKMLYARAGIPVYWLINLPAWRVEVYSNPTGPDPTPDYRHRSDHGLDDLVPLILDGQEVARIAVKTLIPFQIPG